MCDAHQHPYYSQIRDDVIASADRSIFKQSALGIISARASRGRPGVTRQGRLPAHLFFQVMLFFTLALDVAQDMAAHGHR